MAEGGKSHLRVYCICGQKMKVSERMFGLNGKCVACRQKIRVPRPDELPEGVNEIYLKDHPEFLRKVKSRPKKSHGKSREAEAAVAAESYEGPSMEDRAVALAVAEEMREEVALASEGEPVSTIPLDVLEPLRTICSIGRKLRRQLRGLDKGDSLAFRTTERIDRVAAVRSELDEQLRQMLMEVAIELSSTQEKLVKIGLSARVGEMDYGAYRNTSERLRRRRDRLERRQQNLRGWLATNDPHLAGGFADLPFESLPEDGFSIPVPVEHEDEEGILAHHTAALREALHARAHADRKLAAMKNMMEEPVQTAKADAKAERKRAQAAVLFWRHRLEQLKMDYGADNEVIDAQLDLAGGRLQIGEIDRPKFDIVEGQLLRDKTEISKAKSLIDRALQAHSVEQVPSPAGSGGILGRLNFGGPEAVIGPDAWLAWGAALFMGVSIFLPAVGNLSLIQSYLEYNVQPGLAPWAFVVPVVFGVMVALAAGVPEAALRGRLMAMVWVLATLAGCFLIHEAAYGAGPMAARFRVPPHWLTRPGMLLLVIAHAAVFLSVCIALASEDRGRLWALAAGVIGVAGAAAIFSDFGGVARPRPVITVNVAPGSGDETAQRRTIAIHNDGPRTMHLTSNVSDALGAYAFAVERQIGQNSWSPLPTENIGVISRGAVRAIGQRETARASLLLDPGSYRVRLRSAARNEELTEFFVVEAPSMPAPLEPAPEARQDEPEEAATPGLSVRTIAEFRLNGIMTGADGEPQFSFVINDFDGQEIRQILSLGDPLGDGWRLEEFNPNLNTLTLRNEQGDLLVVRRGEETKLDQ